MTLTDELKEYRKRFTSELLDDILPYWMKYGVEKERNGFFGAVDLNGNPDFSANKTSVLNARILWTFSYAAILFGNDEYGVIADKAYHVITGDFADKESGGYFMEISSDNKVVNDIKHTYAQAFVIYALCRYYEFRQLDSTLNLIKEFFYLLETKAKDPEYPGYFEAFTRNWELYEKNRMADNNEPKSMNTHLHMLEAYAALYNVWKDELVKIRLTGLMNLFLDRIIRNDGHFGIFFDKSFNESEASKGICSFGHDIEGSWLLWEAANILQDQGIISKMKPVVIRMVDETDRAAVDKDGGLFLESYRYGSHLRTNKHWWLQAETLVGFMNAFQLTGNLHYWETVKLSWNFIDTYVIDHERGEWYTKVSRSGVPFLIEPQDDPSPYYRNDRKIDPWKCPYHNGRAMMELMVRTDELIKFYS